MQAETGKVIILPAVTEQSAMNDQPIVGELIEGDEPLEQQVEAFVRQVDGTADPIVVDLTEVEVNEEQDPILVLTQHTPPLLAMPIPGLAEKMAKALDNIGCRHDGIEIVSVTETAKLAALLSEDSLRFIMIDQVRLDPQNVMDRTIDHLMGRTFADMLDDRYGEALKELLTDGERRKLTEALWSDVWRRRIADERAEFGQIGERLLFITFVVVYHQAAFHKAKETGIAATIEPISRICAAGNHPIGMLRNRKVLVLTA